ncbi:HAD family phosphatase (plasmid) [Streptomyces sp. NBC_01426]|uniref:HAD family hydrolase n=1 Tax=Streptomyces sp. NBC_01426 TaxID=2975866 RepID=UPI002E3623BA|nr:HAD family phosphatase [Streptomyces sp. NBC_01426]
MNKRTLASSSPNPALGASCSPAIPDGILAVIFDFDGTLADTTANQEQSLRAALQPYGLDLDTDWYRRRFGLSIHDLLAALPGARQLPHDEIIGRSRAHLLAHMNTIAPIACSVALLHAAREAGLPCAVASAASRILVHPGIEALGLAPQFEAVVTREDAARGKPAPELFLEAARRIGVPPERCLAVEDAPDGIASALAAGMHVLRVVDGHLAPTGDSDEDTTGLPSRAGVPMPPGCALGLAAARRAATQSGPASVPAPSTADSDR